MKLLRVLLIVANTGGVAILAAIPIGKLLGVIEQEIDSAAVFGWLIFFVPLLASAFALVGIHWSKLVLARRFVVIAMPGSFLMAFLSLFAYWMGPPDYALIGIGAAILLGLNVLALWDPFKAHLESAKADGDG